MASAMETINQLASSAAKAVWGDSNADAHKEPISGATGDVSKGEPYDAGNLDPQEQKQVESSLGTQKSTSDDSPDLADEEYYALSSSSGAAMKDTAQPPLPPRTSERERERDPQESKTSTSENINPEEGKPLDELSGEGPRPVEEVAKEHGGNAALAGEDAAAESTPDTGAAAAAAATAAAADKPKQQTQTPKKSEADKILEEHKNDTGATEQDYVKTTGLAADGGDFDAAKPGAAREADRLMEQKGIKTEDDNNKSSGSHSSGRKSSDSGHHHKDKPSLGERIKNKLHRH